MTRYEDRSRYAVIKTYDGIVEMARQAVEWAERAGTKVNFGNKGTAGVGRNFKDWKDLLHRVEVPDDPELLHLTNQMVERLKGDIPPPKSRSRKGKWDSKTGRVSATRAVAGSRDMFRKTTRQLTTRTQYCTVVCNGANSCMWTPEQIFWRGAGASAAVDLLEAAGYSCEVWVYYNTSGCFESHTTPNGFIACRVKSAGETFDIDTMVTATSGWFFRTVAFSLIKHDPARSYYHLGSPIDNLGEFADVVDPAPGTVPVCMPVVSTESRALEEARKMVEKLTTQLEAA